MSEKVDSQTKIPRISKEEFAALTREHVPFVGKMGVEIERLDHGAVTLRMPCQEDYLRPGGTISGPVMMALADLAMYAVVLSMIGRVELAVTTSLNVNFLHRPEPGDIIAKGSILKLGKRLAVGEVSVYTGDLEDPVAHVTCTYSIPPI
jgi:uncharacterized protein (TIGR00369 family)